MRRLVVYLGGITRKYLDSLILVNNAMRQLAADVNFAPQVLAAEVERLQQFDHPLANAEASILILISAGTTMRSNADVPQSGQPVLHNILEPRLATPSCACQSDPPQLRGLEGNRQVDALLSHVLRLARETFRRRLLAKA